MISKDIIESKIILDSIDVIMLRIIEGKHTLTLGELFKETGISHKGGILHIKRLLPLRLFVINRGKDEKWRFKYISLNERGRRLLVFLNYN